jgi:four helix bundle protein
MKGEQFRNRTKSYALELIRLFSLFPKSEPAQILGKQAVRSATSVAANYREACRAGSRAEFISKIGYCQQEADETALWLELLEEGCEIKLRELTALKKEAEEILSILVVISKKAKKNEETQASASRLQPSTFV